MPAVCPLGRYQGVLRDVVVHVGGRPLRMLFDLGAGVTSLDERVAEEMGLRPTHSVTGTRMTGARLEIAMLEPVALALGGHPLGGRSLGRADLRALLPAGWPPVDGVLALDALERVPFTADFAGDRMAVGPPPEREGLAPVRIRKHRQIPGVSLVVLVAVAGPREDLWFELDNSNTGPVLLSPGAAAALGIPGGPPCEAELDVPGLGAVRAPALVREILYDGNLGRSFTDARRFAFDLDADSLRVG